MAGRIVTGTDSEDAYEPLNHRDAFDCAGEYRPCAALSVRVPVWDGPAGNCVPAVRNIEETAVVNPSCRVGLRKVRRRNRPY